MEHEYDYRPPSNGGGHQAAPAAPALTPEIQREMMEAQSQVMMAKKFPRNEDAAIASILKSCNRKSLAEVAAYSYNRGKQEVTGPSIRLAEAIAQKWGNMQYGWKEVQSTPTRTEVQVVAWDMESNQRVVRSFWVEHVRVTKTSSTRLTDPRDIYEHVANQAARRLRAAILAVIPGDVVELALAACEKALTTGNTEPLEQRIQTMLGVFAGYGVTQEQIGAKFGKNVGALSEQDMVRLRNAYNSIKDGMAKAADIFGASKEAEADKKGPMDRIKSAGQKAAAQPPADEPGAYEPEAEDPDRPFDPEKDL